MRAPARNGTVPEGDARRLANQIERAFRGTYGARTGLRTIVQLVTRRMLMAGSTPETIAAAIESCVLNHPAGQVDDPRNVVTGLSKSATLAALARQYVEETALDVAAATAAPAAPLTARPIAKVAR